MTFNEIIAVFERYAESHVDIKHSEENKGFVACHTDTSPDQEVKECTSDVVLVLVTPDKEMMPPSGENYNWNKNICFFLLKRCERKDTATIVAAQGAAEAVGDDFFAKLLEDRYSAIRSFKPETYVQQPIGPMFSDMYGQACMFNLVDEAEYWVKPDRWS